MARALDIIHLINQPESYRNREWERAFFHAFPESKLELIHKEAQQGPDGWPYLQVKISPEAKEPAPQVLKWLADKGVGMVLNPHKMMPDYIFTYGMLWNYKERGEFVTKADKVPLGEVEYPKGQEVLAGPPSKDYLPEYVKTVLREFFRQQGIKEIKILVLSSDKEHFDLCFSVESLGRPDQNEHPGIAEAIAWFLPGHYSVVLTSEEGLPDFYEL